MKKIMISMLAFLLMASAYGQIDTINRGTGPNSKTGETLWEAFGKVNVAIETLNDTCDVDDLHLKYNEYNILDYGAISGDGYYTSWGVGYRCR